MSIKMIFMYRHADPMAPMVFWNLRSYPCVDSEKCPVEPMNMACAALQNSFY